MTLNSIVLEVFNAFILGKNKDSIDTRYPYYYNSAMGKYADSLSEKKIKFLINLDLSKESYSTRSHTNGKCFKTISSLYLSGNKLSEKTLTKFQMRMIRKFVLPIIAEKVNKKALKSEKMLNYILKNNSSLFFHKLIYSSRYSYSLLEPIIRNNKNQKIVYEKFKSSNCKRVKNACSLLLYNGDYIWDILKEHGDHLSGNIKRNLISNHTAFFLNNITDVLKDDYDFARVKYVSHMVGHGVYDGAVMLGKSKLIDKIYSLNKSDRLKAIENILEGLKSSNSYLSKYIFGCVAQSVMYLLSKEQALFLMSYASEEN